MTENNPSKLAWRVFRDEFKDGEFIVIEDDQGQFTWGTLRTATNNGILLVRTNGKDRFLYWDEIIFMAHDGFPVQEIMKMSYEEAEERVNQTSTQIIRDKLLKLVNKSQKNEKRHDQKIWPDSCPNCNCSGKAKWVQDRGVCNRCGFPDTHNIKKPKPRNSKHIKSEAPPSPGGRRISVGGGCPFVFGPAYIENILYPGNNGPQFWGEDNEETLVLRAEDGAVMHSYDMSHLFLFDGLQIPESTHQEIRD